MRRIQSTAGALQTLSSNIVSAVYIQCQSQRTRPKENWHSVWLSWCYLKLHPGVCNNPQCAPHTVSTATNHFYRTVPCCISSFASDWSTYAVDVHPLFWSPREWDRETGGGERERERQAGRRGPRVGGRRRDRVIRGLITVGNVRVPIQGNDEGLCGGGLWEPTKTALVSLAECICIA